MAINGRPLKPLPFSTGPPGPPGPPGPSGSGNMQHSAFAMRLGYNNPDHSKVIHFAEAIYNEQGHYSTETGVFSCVVPGVYQLDFHCTYFDSAGDVDMRCNGELVAHTFTTRQNGYITASGGVVLKLHQGDRVWLQANYGASGITADSYFLGHLLFEAWSWPGDRWNQTSEYLRYSPVIHSCPPFFLCSPYSLQIRSAQRSLLLVPFLNEVFFNV